MKNIIKTLSLIALVLFLMPSCLSTTNKPVSGSDTTFAEENQSNPKSKEMTVAGPEVEKTVTSDSVKEDNTVDLVGFYRSVNGISEPKSRYLVDYAIEILLRQGAPDCINSFRQVKAGTSVVFGHYAGKDLVWKCLKKEGNCFLLAMQTDSYPATTGISVDKVFSPDERSLIQVSYVIDSGSLKNIGNVVQCTSSDTICCINTEGETLSHTISERKQFFSIWVDLEGVNCGLEIVIPDNVTRIEKSAFSEFKDATSIVIPDSVTSIEVGTLSGFSKLEELTLPFVGSSENAFWSESTFGAIFGSASFDGAVKIIQNNCYFYIPASIRSVTITKQTELPDSSFESCHMLTEVEVSSSLTKIGLKSFSKCSSLESVYGGCGVLAIGDEAFLDCGKLSEIELFDSIRTIGDRAFQGCVSLRELEFSNNLISIGKNAFKGLSYLKELDLPSSLTSIGAGAFDLCPSIREIKVPSVTKLSQITDSYRNVKKVTLTNQASIPEDAFANCSSLEKIFYPNGLRSIGDRAFKGCTNLSEGITPAAITNIGDEAFSGCTALGTVELSGTLVSIGDSAFKNCSSLILEGGIPKTVTSIGEEAFNGCSSLTEIHVPGGVNTIGNKVFSGCTSVTSLIIDEGVSVIREKAFMEMSKVTELVIPTSVTKIEAGALQGLSNLVQLTVPFVGVEDQAYWTLSMFGAVFGSAPYKGSERIIQNNCVFYIPSSLKSVVVSMSTALPDYAFENCKMLESIVFLNEINSIGTNAFGGCSNTLTLDTPKFNTIP